MQLAASENVLGKLRPNNLDSIVDLDGGVNKSNDFNTNPVTSGPKIEE